MLQCVVRAWSYPSRHVFFSQHLSITHVLATMRASRVPRELADRHVGGPPASGLQSRSRSAELAGEVATDTEV